MIIAEEVTNLLRKKAREKKTLERLLFNTKLAEVADAAEVAETSRLRLAEIHREVKEVWLRLVGHLPAQHVYVSTKGSTWILTKPTPESEDVWEGLLWMPLTTPLAEWRTFHKPSLDEAVLNLKNFSQSFYLFPIPSTGERVRDVILSQLLFV